MTEKEYPLDCGLDQRLRVKRSHLAVTTKNGDLLFPFSPDELIGAQHLRLRYQVLALLDGKRTVREILTSLRQKNYRGSLEEVLEIVQCLAREKVLESCPDQEEGAASRYDRQQLFMASFAEDGRQFSADIQERLGATRIAVLGIGGIGSHALLALLSMGVGNLIVVDDDRVALSNLNRQFFYAEMDLGRNKIDVLKEKCPQYNPAPHYTFLHRRLRSTADCIEVMQGCDLVLMTADSPRDKIFHWSHQAAGATSTPVLYTQGVILDTLAVGPLYIPGQTNCFHCFYPQTAFDLAPPRFHHINQAYRHGSCMPHIAITGQLMALEAVKHLTGFHPCRLYNHKVSINLDTYALEYSRGAASGCPWCDSSRQAASGTR